MKTKQEIRNNIKDKFNDISSDEISLKSEYVNKKIKNYLQVNSYKNICVYENMGDEPETGMLISELREDWYNVYTPQMICDTEMMLIDDDYDHYEKEIDVFIIPGRAFTQDGKRLGRGKWYYDRFLSQKIYKRSRKIWVCFDFQLFENIPTEKHDIIMYKVFTND